jgi:tRNA G10  N-methylase Trm11
VECEERWNGCGAGQGHEDSPLWYVKLPDDATAKRICERSILVKGIYDLWGEGDTFEEMRDAAVACPADKKTPYFAPELSFKVRGRGECPTAATSTQGSS